MENNPYQSPAQKSDPATDKPAPHLLAKTTSMFLRHAFLLAAIDFVLVFVYSAF